MPRSRRWAAAARSVSSSTVRHRGTDYTENTLGPSPGGKRHPGHRVLIKEFDGRWTASIAGTVLADSSAKLAIDEDGYRRRVDIPPTDVRTELFAVSESRTSCPFKGEAHDYATEIGGRRQNVAWYYPAVFDEAAPLAGFVAFCDDRASLSSE